MHEADDVYMSYAAKGELAQFLNELLEAQRATAQVTLQSAVAADTALAATLQTIQRDATRCCDLLLGHLNARAETVSSKVGPFYHEAMAIEDPGERMALLNRNRQALAHKLRAMLPRVRDTRLHADLSGMLQLHEADMALASRAGRTPS